MLHDLVVVGAGPVGATLALALRDADLDLVVLDSRAAGTPSRTDRSLALSHGARLILERLDVWARLSANRDAVTPITSIDISQAGGFGMDVSRCVGSRPPCARLCRSLSSASSGVRCGISGRRHCHSI
jgi:2-polyprenyl-6-methoxyphenol hydroxylase-like FAD-dependent oxidoreductase